MSWKFKFWVLNCLLKTLQLFFVLYGSFAQECSAGVPGNVQLFRHCSGVFRCSAGVPYSVVPCSGIPGFIVCCLAGDFVLIWMKQRLVWFNLQRDGTRNGLSNIKETFAENLQLQMSVLHQIMRIFRGWSLKLTMMTGKKVM